MRGILHMEVDEKGIRTTIQMKEVGYFEKMSLLKNFMNALEMKPEDVVKAVTFIEISSKLEEALKGCFNDDNDDEDEDDDDDDENSSDEHEEDDPNWGVGWGCKASEPEITQAKFYLGAIEKLYGKKKNQQEDS